MTERQLDPKTVLNPKLWFAPPEGRRVLMQSIVEVRPKEPLEIHLDVFGAATGEAKRDERSLLLSVYWLDQNRSLLESLPKDFVKSAEYGNFKYLAYPAEDGS